MNSFTKEPIEKYNSDQLKKEKNKLVLSYLTLRNIIGFSGLLLPLILAIAPSRPSNYYFGFEESISDYYYTDRGDILVVVLCLMGAFLMTYKGYHWTEHLLTFCAGICGIGVAFMPTKEECLQCALSVHTNNGGVFNSMVGSKWHFIFAATFLFCLAIMSLVFFTRSKPDDDHKLLNGQLNQKGKRNIVFKICGWVMIASLVILGVYFIIEPELGKFPIVFIFETIAVVAFGVSWITKGQTLWPDGEHYISKGVKKFRTKFF